ncbi:hypothetical protein B296_00025400 [Ensete ventricosum]|uniref:CP12 domain-containing protein n=1 Tax=Ensete ventricosum TaxID=4639 RepID=A0A427AI39_ENSVE|nr:hypothetical protein B296_00025400 [Ensete ventricosum]
MAIVLAGISISIPRVVSMKAELPKPPLSHTRLLPWTSGHRASSRRAVLVASAPSTPLNNISEKVVESIKNAEATCAEDAASGECAAAWDEVEELSAAASHARDKLKVDDPLESFCKDNPDNEE